MFVKVIQSQKQSLLTMLFKWLGFLGDSQFSLIVAEIPNSEGPKPQSQSTEKTHWIIVQVDILARAISP